MKIDGDISGGYVQTVIGRIEPHRLGVTQMHEHLLIDLVGSSTSPGSTEEERRKWAQRVELENYYDVRRSFRLYRENLQLLDVSVASDELALYRAAGGQSVVELTTRDLGRNPDGLRRVSQETGAHIVMGTGFYVHSYHPPEIGTMGVSDVAQLLIEDLAPVTGVDMPRAGIIGEIGLSWPKHPDEAKVLDAAVLAQRSMGVAIAVHPGRDVAAPMDAVRQIHRAGGDISRTIICHVDRTLFDRKDMRDLLETGCYAEFDLFGQESAYYDLSPVVDMPNDATRVDALIDLVDGGYSDHLLVSQDICRKANLTRYGGEGYGHLLTRVVPLMRRKGMTDSDIRGLLVDNPARVLTVASTSSPRGVSRLP